jgi:hypothetical protein
MYTKRNSKPTWINLVEVRLFCVEHMIKRTMVMLTRTMYEHYEEAGPTPPWRRSRRVRPAASALAAGSHQNQQVCHAAPRRAPMIYATTTSMNTFSQERMNTHTYTIAVYNTDANHVFYVHRNKKKLITGKLCATVWRGYSPKEILNDEPCATNLTKFSQICFKQNWRLHQTKLKMDSQNGFTSSRCIFFYVGHMFQRTIVVVLCGLMSEVFKQRREKVKRGWGEASLCAGVDHFCLTGARDEGGSGDTLDSSVSTGPVWRVLWTACGPRFRCSPGIQLTDIWLHKAWSDLLQATNRAPTDSSLVPLGCMYIM